MKQLGIGFLLLLSMLAWQGVNLKEINEREAGPPRLQKAVLFQTELLRPLPEEEKLGRYQIILQGKNYLNANLLVKVMHPQRGLIHQCKLSSIELIEDFSPLQFSEMPISLQREYLTIKIMDFLEAGYFNPPPEEKPLYAGIL